MMATGRQFSPTIPVLTSIFKGLREIQSILGETTQYITFPIHFLVVGLQKKISTHRTTTSYINSVGMNKYADKELRKHFNESQANALFRNPKRIISHVLFFMARVTILQASLFLQVLDFFW
jgi:hypothetical protein